MYYFGFFEALCKYFEILTEKSFVSGSNMRHPDSPRAQYLLLIIIADISFFLISHKKYEKTYSLFHFFALYLHFNKRYAMLCIVTYVNGSLAFIFPSIVLFYIIIYHFLLPILKN